MEIGHYIAIPSALAAIIGVIAIFILIGRKDQQLMDHTNKLKDHENTLKECGQKSTITIEECRIAQDACAVHQKEANLRIISDIADLKNDVRNNRIEVMREVRTERETVRNELMKLTQMIGKIDGAVGRLRIDGDGRVKP